uniref:Kelch domain-containing protein 10 n=2 Tax=Cacopsylla melanoneura TaxID=428564 RepID=A0A8D9EF61_9HEMI
MEKRSQLNVINVLKMYALFLFSFSLSLSQYHIVFISGGGDVIDDVWRLDLLRLQWTRLPLRLPNKVYFHATTVSPQDKVYMFGGITCTTSGPDDDSSSGSNETSATERTADLYSTYLTIPRLREICLEAVKYYYKKHTYETRLVESYGISLR